MTPPGHFAGGYLLGRLLSKPLNLQPPHKNKLLLLATIAGFLPDFDAFYYVLRYRSLAFDERYTHHRWISHTFPLYLLPGLAVYLLAGRRSRLWQQAAVLVTAAAAAHLVQDSVGAGEGIMWFWPFSKRRYGIVSLKVEGGRQWLETYRKHPISWIERLIIFAAAASFIITWWNQRRG